MVFGYLFLFLVEKVFWFHFQVRKVGETGTLRYSMSQGWEVVVMVSMEVFRNMQVRLKKVPAV